MALACSTAANIYHISTDTVRHRGKRWNILINWRIKDRKSEKFLQKWGFLFEKLLNNRYQLNNFQVFMYSTTFYRASFYSESPKSEPFDGFQAINLSTMAIFL